jgi:molybdopterin molybdotransferase
MKNTLITFGTARKLLKENLFTLNSIKIPVKNAVSYVLSEDIHSPIDLPPFTNSAMDGYAVRFGMLSLVGKIKTKCSGCIYATFYIQKKEIKAGDYKRIKLKPGDAVKVFTGSPLPSNTDAVVMKEFTEIKNGILYVKKQIKKGENIRFRGEEIKKGQKVLKKGTYLNPAGIGFLSTMGIKEVKVIRKPKVYVIITGNELVEPGKKLKEGKIYDANSFSLYSALKSAGVKEIKIKRIKDDFEKIKKEFYKALEFADIILFSGGISVGDYDFVRDLMERERVKTVFYKVKQKPGKPLYFGKFNKKLIFALPGNPASVLVCFYEYVYPAIRALSGFKDIFLPEKEFILLRDIKKKTNRLWFLKGKIKNKGVIPLDFQESHMLSSFAKADCLIVAPRNRKLLKKGEKVKVHILPQSI